jgi:hypothetical protein
VQVNAGFFAVNQERVFLRAKLQNPTPHCTCTATGKPGRRRCTGTPAPMGPFDGGGFTRRWCQSIGLPPSSLFIFEPITGRHNMPAHKRNVSTNPFWTNNCNQSLNLGTKSTQWNLRLTTNLFFLTFF